MAGPFSSFVVFAEMRTGSNFLEANLNAFEGVTCHGEAFNPHFIGYPNKDDILGVTMAQREENPGLLLSTIRDRTKGIGGFRYFHDHEPRLFDLVMNDPKCAKIVLTRNPVDSYVSWKIARATGQWKLSDVKARKEGQAEFDSDEFNSHLEALQAFQVTLLNRLQVSGQTAFYVAYEDLQSVDVMNGIARFLGVNEQLDQLDKSLKKQNPSPISEKVSNFAEMEQALSGLDRFNLTRTPNFEPRRGPGVQSYVAAAESAALYMPIKCGPEEEVLGWLADLDAVGRGKLIRRMSQKDLRQWKRRQGHHRSFTVIRHPLLRAHRAFCKHILSTGKDSFVQLRKTLIRRYKMPLPDEVTSDWTAEAHRTAFAAFLTFLKGNLAGQSAVRVDAAWCTQAQTLQGFGEFCLPDVIIRETEMAEDLALIARRLGHSGTIPLRASPPENPYDLADIYDDGLEALGADVYQRDYMMFGFGRWR